MGKVLCILKLNYFNNEFSKTMDMGAVGGMRNVKNAVSVARHVLENTKHSILVGSLASKFAVQLGFKKESLATNSSINKWKTWEANNCQPNFWKVVILN